MKPAHLLVILFAAMSSPALADVTATYAGPSPRWVLQVEISANGDTRFGQAKGGQYFITRGGETFWIQIKPTGSVVMRTSDILRVVADYMKSSQATAGGRNNRPVPVLVKRGRATINGRVGDAYYAEQQAGSAKAKPVVVMSDDPALAPLGPVFARQFILSQAMSGESSDAGKAMGDLVGTGAPLVMPDAELLSVTFAKVDTSRFDLPATPLSLEAVRQDLASSHQ
jgi:hypothetical protein